MTWWTGTRRRSLGRRARRSVRPSLQRGVAELAGPLRLGDGTLAVARRSPSPDSGQVLQTDHDATVRFHAAAERVRTAEVRLGWLRALNLQGSGGLAKLGPITAVVAAAFMGHHQPGTLMAIYLLAQRVFWGFDGLVDLRLDTQSVRGAVTRCFELIDTPATPSKPSTYLRSTTPEQPSLLQSASTIEPDLKPACKPTAPGPGPRAHRSPSAQWTAWV